MIAQDTHFLDLIETFEGLSLKIYTDTVGKVSAGYGHNLTDKGVSLAVANLMRAEDAAEATQDALKLPVFKSLSQTRQDILKLMVYQLGLPKVLEFKKMLEALRCGRFQDAADEMRNSAWHDECPARVRAMALMMELDRYLSEAELRQA